MNIPENDGDIAGAFFKKEGKPNYIDTLPPNGINVLLMRRTGNITVKTAVGSRWADGKIHDWFAARPPTYWVELPPWDKATP